MWIAIHLIKSEVIHEMDRAAGEQEHMQLQQWKKLYKSPNIIVDYFACLIVIYIDTRYAELTHFSVAF